MMPESHAFGCVILISNTLNFVLNELCCNTEPGPFLIYDLNTTKRISQGHEQYLCQSQSYSHPNAWVSLKKHKRTENQTAANALFERLCNFETLETSHGVEPPKMVR